jgi:hypothetical protein
MKPLVVASDRDCALCLKTRPVSLNVPTSKGDRPHGYAAWAGLVPDRTAPVPAHGFLVLTATTRIARRVAKKFVYPWFGISGRGRGHPARRSSAKHQTHRNHYSDTRKVAWQKLLKGYSVGWAMPTDSHPKTMVMVGIPIHTRKQNNGDGGQCPPYDHQTGNIFRSNISVGIAIVQQAFGISTMPLIRPSTGAQLSNKYACSPVKPNFFRYSIAFRQARR